MRPRESGQLEASNVWDLFRGLCSHRSDRAFVKPRTEQLRASMYDTRIKPTPSIEHQE